MRGKLCWIALASLKLLVRVGACSKVNFTFFEAVLGPFERGFRVVLGLTGGLWDGFLEVLVRDFMLVMLKVVLLGLNEVFLKVLEGFRSIWHFRGLFCGFLDELFLKLLGRGLKLVFVIKDLDVFDSICQKENYCIW